MARGSDPHGAEVPDEVGDEFVMVAGDVDDARPFAPGPEQLLNHVVVRLRPVEATLELPDVDEVAHDVERVELMLAEELEERLRLAAAGSEMHIGDPAGAIVFRVHGLLCRWFRTRVKDVTPARRRFYLSVTFPPRKLRIELAVISSMQTSSCKLPPETDSRQRCARNKRKLVTQVLREAYRRHVRDAMTRQAVRQALGV